MFFKGKIYDSIHNCPIGVYFRIIESGDLSLLGKGKPYNLANAWQNINNERLQAFGIQEEYERYLSLREKASSYYADAYLKKQKHLKAYAKIAEEEAFAIFDPRKNENIDHKKQHQTQVQLVTKKIGSIPSLQKTTVYEFLTALHG